MARHNEEYEEQKALIRWAKMRSATLPELKSLIHVPNGGYLLSPSAASKLKATGLSAGFPDLALFKQRHGYAALFIEMKSTKGRVNPKQQAWHDRLRKDDYAVEVCHCFDEAVRIIESYLGMGNG